MTIKDYINLPYSILTKKISDEDGEYYFASVEELDGCMTTGETLAEAYENIVEAMEVWIETKLEANEEIPLPVDSEYSGKVLLRIPKTLHKTLAFNAKNEGISLNQYMTYKLSNNQQHLKRL